MKRRKNAICFLICLVCLMQNRVDAQYHQDVLPSLSGVVLLDELVEQYKPVNVLSYSSARKQMYTKIYNVNDTLECVYSGHKLYVSQNDPDAIQTLIMNGSPNGINCEHTFPQSMGAGEGNARSDMFHLFPSRSEVNSARGNHPFAEINDASTDRWFINNTEQSFIPSNNIDAYSEQIDGKFEPKEVHKGNVARAMFYFFTMYKGQANASFFNQQKDVLCDWHLLDPVDSLEWFRAQEIAVFQDGKVNPFILDCSLVKRTYCSDAVECEIVSATGEQGKPDVQIAVYPNPAELYYLISIELDQTYHTTIQLLNMNGQMVQTISQRTMQAGDYELSIAEGLSGLPSGMYMISISLIDEMGRSYVQFEKLVKQ